MWTYRLLIPTLGNRINYSPAIRDCYEERFSDAKKGMPYGLDVESVSGTKVLGKIREFACEARGCGFGFFSGEPWVRSVLIFSTTYHWAILISLVPNASLSWALASRFSPLQH